MGDKEDMDVLQPLIPIWKRYLVGVSAQSILILRYSMA